MSDPLPLPDSLRQFIASSKWTFAKTMPEWPHEYIVRERVDEKLFEQLVHHIRTNGFEAAFYQETFIYFEEDGLLYWTMGNPINDTTIINRCKKENSYECRLKNGTLPPAPTHAEQRAQDDLMKLPPEMRERVAHRSAIARKVTKEFWDSAET
jgi:hypothetical protein